MTATPTRPSALTLMLTAAAFVVVVAGMRSAQPIIVPFLLSIFVAIICAPPLFWLEEHGLPRALAMLIVVAGIIAAALALSLLVGSSMRDFTRDVPTYRVRINGTVTDVVAWMQSKGIAITREDVFGLGEPGRVLQVAGDVFNGFGGVLSNAFLIFLTVVFILFEASSFPAKLRAIAPDPERSLARFHGFTENLRRYLAIKTVASLGTGVSIGIWLAVVGVDYPVLWGMLAFLLNYVPNIGSVIAAVPAVLLALVQLGPAAAGWSMLGYLVVNVLFGNVIEPRFMGRGLGLSTLVVFLSLVFWGWVLGLVGMFLSVPLTMTAKIALDSHPDTRWLAIMLGPERAATATDGPTPPGDEGTASRDPPGA